MAYGSRGRFPKGKEDTAEGRWSREITGHTHPIEAERTVKRVKSETLKSHPQHVLPPATPPTADQMFKYGNLCGHFSFKLL